MVEQSFDGFEVLCTPTFLDDKGRDEVRGGVGSPHLRLSWPMFWSVSGWLGLFLQFLASVRIRICICWLSMDRWWVLTVLGGVSRLFSFLDLGWCEGMVDDGGVMRKGVCDV